MNHSITAEAAQHFIEERYKLAIKEMKKTKAGPERDELMFWKGVNAALDIEKIMKTSIARSIKEVCNGTDGIR